MRGLFVTGTDTEVGKTHIAAGVLHLLGAGGQRSAGLKPVAAGRTMIDGVLANEDVHALRIAGSVALTDAEVGPCQFDTACAPHVAARLEGRAISRRALVDAARATAARCDWLVVEGVGGWRVPLGDNWDSADLAVDLGLPVLLVVGLRLGCLSHALLTVDAVRARGLPLLGWVVNRIDPSMLLPEDSVATLQHWLGDRLGLSCFGVVPWLTPPDAASAAAHLDGHALRRALAKVAS